MPSQTFLICLYLLLSLTQSLKMPNAISNSNINSTPSPTPPQPSPPLLPLLDNKSSNPDMEIRTLKLGETITLETMGPIIINTDGMIAKRASQEEETSIFAMNPRKIIQT